MAKEIMNKKTPSPVKCYYCDNLIEYERELVTQKVPLVCKNGKIRYYTRKFHAECAVKYSKEREDTDKRKIETDDWNTLYNYVKKLMVSENEQLDDFMRLRLQGMRVGKFAPNGTNVRMLDRGYPYKVILLTFKAYTPMIQQLLNERTFNDEKHRINLVMKIISQNISTIYRRYIELEKSKKLVEGVNENIEAVNEAEYVKVDRETIKTIDDYDNDNDIDYSEMFV